ncbi:hypothetical protein M011DRAFT_470187 [Sporormia fimetaria CBS 119925]|uniref:Calcofluor white hypersensitive protein n=1 Tax=Sporormia fimetaria CBS 119925 TaxID=1340428 RepID=A0A6A6V327_9PLEO|nr:hypothetical protein M011DRAFT_470187 [Sporormia fimetaria CBS 119925]
MSRKVVGWGGLAAAGGVAYYLYSAGGNPKLATKQAEHDAATAVRKVKGDLPGQDKEAKKAGEEGMEAMKVKISEVGEQAKHEAHKVDAKLEEYRRDAAKKLDEARREGNQAVDKFDKEVTQAASNTKSWFSGWFGK